MRGKIGQDPMIIDVPCSTSSDAGSSSSRFSNESPGPETPPTSVGVNQDRRFLWKPEHDTETPVAYDQSRGSKSTNQTGATDLKNRGRRPMPKIDTDVAGEKLPTLERARSPYASGPQDEKSKAKRMSSEYLLSPDVMSPRPKIAEGQRAHSYYSPTVGKYAVPQEADQNSNRTAHAVHPPVPPLGRHASESSPVTARYAYPRDMDRGLDSPRQRQPTRPAPEAQRPQSHYVPRPVEVHNTGRPEHDRDDARQPVRPRMERHRSSAEYYEGSSAAREISSRPRRHQGISDDTDGDTKKLKGGSSQLSPQSPATYSKTYSGDVRQDQSWANSQRPDQRRSLTSLEMESHPVNLKSLVSGAGIHHVLNATALGAMLNSESIHGRQASPRPSPRPSPGVSPMGSPHASPTTSPYPSPPRTPPNERRVNPIMGLKKDSPTSRPSSPLSSRSSTFAHEPNMGPQEVEQTGRPRPVSRQTVPLPVPRVEESQNMLAPGIAVRSPSPAAPGKLNTAGASDYHHPHGRADSVVPTDSPQNPSLRPTGYSGRPRARSSADVRPQLTVNPAPLLQPSDSALPANSRQRAPSPSLNSPSERYKPAYLDSTPLSADGMRSSHSRPDPSPADYRSRAHVSTLPSPSQRSRSSVPMPGSSRPRALSSTSRPVVPISNPKPLPSLPVCARPHAEVGFNDWYTLRHNTTFAICPACRDNVFGPDYDRYLMPHPAPTKRKIRCDLNNPWIRLACLLHGPDVILLGKLSDITAQEGECQVDDETDREWYRLTDPATGKHISNFNACPQCVHSLWVLFPNWRTEFYRSDYRERACALRRSGVRFGEYLDMIVESAQEADRSRKPLNTAPLIKLAKKIASLRDCPRDSMESRKAWHIHSHIPEFTICPACYEEVVYPLVKARSSIAKQIDREPQVFPNPEVEVCCHLYSPRMRKIFREACEDDDLEHLRHNAHKRHMLQQDLFAVLAERRKNPDDEEVINRGQELLEQWGKKE